MPTDISFFSPLNFQRYISVFLNRVQIFQVFLFVLLHFVWGQINPDIYLWKFNGEKKMSQ